MSDEVKPDEVKPGAVAFAYEIKKARDSIQDLETKIKWMEANREFLESRSDWDSFGTKNIDFNGLPHKEIVKVIRAFGGKWTKEPMGERVNYRSDNSEGVSIRCYMGEPPPSCKIVEVVEYVPAVPATVRKVRKMVCQPGLSATIAQAIEKGGQDAAQV